MIFSGFLLGSILLTILHVDCVITAPLEDKSSVEEKLNLKDEVSVEAIENNAEKFGTTETNFEEDHVKTLSKREGEAEITELTDDSTADDGTVKINDTNEYPIDKNVDVTTKNAEHPESSSEKTENIAKANTDFDENNVSKSDERVLTKTSEAHGSNSRLMSDVVNSEQDSTNLNNHQSERTDDSKIYEKLPDGDEDTKSAQPEILTEDIESTPSPGFDQNKTLRSIDKTTFFSEGTVSENDASVSEEKDGQPSENNVSLVPNITQEKVAVESLDPHNLVTDITERGGFDHGNLEAEDRRVTTFTDDDANIEIKSRNNDGHVDDEISGLVKPVMFNDVRTFQTFTNQPEYRRFGSQGNLPHLRPMIENNRLMQPPIHNYLQQRSSDHNNLQPHSYHNRPLKDPKLKSSEGSDRHISEFNNRNTLSANAYPFEPNKPKDNNENSRLSGVPELPDIRNGYDRPRIQPQPHGQNMPVPYQNMQASARNVPMPSYNIPAMPNYPAPPHNIPIQNIPVPAYNIMPPRSPNMNFSGYMRNHAYGMQDPQTLTYRSNSFGNTSVVANNNRHLFGRSPENYSTQSYHRTYNPPTFARSRENYSMQSGGLQTRSFEPDIQISLSNAPDIRYTSSFRSEIPIYTV